MTSGFLIIVKKSSAYTNFCEMYCDTCMGQGIIIQQKETIKRQQGYITLLENENRDLRIKFLLALLGLLLAVCFLTSVLGSYIHHQESHNQWDDPIQWEQKKNVAYINFLENNNRDLRIKTYRIKEMSDRLSCSSSLSSQVALRPQNASSSRADPFELCSWLLL